MECFQKFITCQQGGFYHLLHENLQAGRKNVEKQLSEYAPLIDTQEYLRLQVKHCFEIVRAVAIIILTDVRGAIQRYSLAQAINSVCLLSLRSSPQRNLRKLIKSTNNVTLCAFLENTDRFYSKVFIEFLISVHY